MIIYLTIIFVLLFYQLILILDEAREQQNQIKDSQGRQLPKVLYIPIAVLIFWIAAFRSNIGYDFSAYNILYSVFHSSNYTIMEIVSKYNYEIGYVWLNKICSSFQSVIFWMAVLGVGIKLYYIYKWSDCRNLTLFMYFTGVFLTFDMGVIRQGVAISMYFIVMNFCEKGNKGKAIIVIIISCLFHMSSLIYFPIVFIGCKKLAKNKVYMLVFIVTIISFFNLSDLILKLFSFTGISIITTKIEFYSSIVTGNITISYLKRIIFLIVFTEFYKKHGFQNTKEILMYNSYFLSVIFMALFSSIDILGGRGVTAFYIMQYFIFASMYKRVSDINWRIIIVCVCVILSMFTMWSTITYGNSSGQIYTPYTSIWSVL